MTPTAKERAPMAADEVLRVIDRLGVNIYDKECSTARDLETLRTAVAALVAERDALRGEVAQVRSDLSRLMVGEVTVSSFVAEKGRADLNLGGEMIAGMGGILADWYEKNGGPNYCEVGLKSGGREYTLTIQRADGKTPHALRIEAESALADALGLLGECREAGRVLRDLVGDPDAMLPDDWDWHRIDATLEPQP